MVKHIGYWGDKGWWESDDNQRWRRISDEETQRLLDEVTHWMKHAMERIVEHQAQESSRRKKTAPTRPITEAEIKRFEKALAAYPTAHAPEDDER